MRRSLQFPLVLLGCLALAAYFGHHTVSGKYGLKAQTALQDRSISVLQQLARLEAVRATLNRDIALLNEAPPNRDLVEELAQRVLGFAYPDDVVFRAAPPDVTVTATPVSVRGSTDVAR